MLLFLGDTICPKNTELKVSNLYKDYHALTKTYVPLRNMNELGHVSQS